MTNKANHTQENAQDQASSSAQACTHPDKHVHNVDELLNHVETECKERGLRFTKRRRQVLRRIAEEGKPVKAYDLMDMLRTDEGPLAPPSVYRALDFLVDNGFIHKLESIKSFVACHHPTEEHSVPFLICDACQSVVELEDNAVVDTLNKHAEKLGFSTRTQVLEVHGLCALCRRKNEPLLT